MPQRIPGVPGSGHDGGILLTETEWDRVTGPLGCAGDTLDVVLNRLASTVTLNYDVPAVVRALIDAGEPGSTVPPNDLPAAITRIGEARHRAELHARTLAGEVADLTDRLEQRLPEVFELVLDGIADDTLRDLTGEVVDEAAGMIVDAGCAALRIARRITEVYDVRDREDTRPTDAPRPGVRVRNDAGAPSTRDYWVRGVGSVHNPFTDYIDHFRREAAAAGVHLPDVEVVDGRVLGPRLHLWGQPVTVDHPAVIYIADHIGPLTGCDGTPHCKRATVAQAFYDATDNGTKAHPTDVLTRETAHVLHPLVATGITYDWTRDLILNGIRHAGQTLHPPNHTTGV